MGLNDKNGAKRIESDFSDFTSHFRVRFGLFKLSKSPEFKKKSKKSPRSGFDSFFELNPRDPATAKWREKDIKEELRSSLTTLNHVLLYI